MTKQNNSRYRELVQYSKINLTHQLYQQTKEEKSYDHVNLCEKII